MHRIDGPGNIGNQWVEKDALLAQPGTTHTSDFQNAIQEEIAAVIEDTGQSLNKGDNAQLLAAITSIASGGSVAAGHKNYILNPDGDIAQRDVTSGAFSYVIGVAETYWADRWFGFNSSGPNPIARRFSIVGDVDRPVTQVSTPPENALRFDTIASGSFRRFGQRIENVRQFDGIPVTVSFWARDVNAASDLTLELRQNFGQGGGEDPEVVVGSQLFNLSTTFQRFTLTLTPAATFKNLGADGGDHLVVEFQTENGTQTIVDVTRVQLETGSVASVIDRRPFGEELALCKRYYEKSWELHNRAVTTGSPGAAESARDSSGQNVFRFQRSFTVEKRSNNLSGAGLAAGSFRWFDEDGVPDAITVAGSQRLVTIYNDVATTSTGYPSTAGTATGRATAFWDCDVELVE